jgi:hypothetical protein
VIIGLVALVTGSLGIISGVDDDFYGVHISSAVQGNIILDSNLRYFSGVWLGLGIILFWIIPSIEKQKLLFRSLCLMIFIGALGRLISIMMIGVPSLLFVSFTFLELCFPLLILWQNKLNHADA